MADEPLSFDDDPSEFPEIWNSDEGPIEVQIDIDDIINKHVFLALQEYWKDVWITEGISKTGAMEITVGLGDWHTKEFDLEAHVLKVTRIHHSREDYLKMAASLTRMVDHITKLAGTAPTEENIAKLMQRETDENDK